MASFSESEVTDSNLLCTLENTVLFLQVNHSLFSFQHEVFEHKGKRKEIKKEVEFSSGPLSPSRSTNVAGPPVYYPPGSTEFSKREEALAMGGKSGVSI